MYSKEELSLESMPMMDLGKVPEPKYYTVEELLASLDGTYTSDMKDAATAVWDSTIFRCTGPRAVRVQVLQYELMCRIFGAGSCNEAYTVMKSFPPRSLEVARRLAADPLLSKEPLDLPDGLAEVLAL